MKIRVLWALFALYSFSSVSAFAEPPEPSDLPTERAEFFHKMSSSFMEVIEKGSPYFDEGHEQEIWILKLIRSPWFQWAPNGKPRWTSQACSAHAFQKKILQETGNEFSQIAEGFENYLKKCSPEFETGWNDILTNAAGSMILQMEPNRHPYARHVMFNLPNKIKLKGLLFLKGDQKKRPLIVFRTGIFSNTQNFNPERFLVMQGFEQSPFNMLILESMSGSEFVKHNEAFAWGGFDEGLQNFLIARELQDPKEPLSKLIDSIHLLGMSMGSHGVLYATLLNELNQKPSKPKVINSTLAYCPLLNMRDTLDYHMSQGFSMDIMNYWASRRLPELVKRYPEVTKESFIPEILKVLESNYTGPVIAENGQLPSIQVPPVSKEGFWQRNDFWPQFKNVKTPVMIFATHQDPVVSWFINSGRIDDGRMNFTDSNLKMIAFDQGYHCSLAVAYDWSGFAGVLQTYFLKQSPHFQMENKTARFPMTPKALEFVKNLKEPVIEIDFSVEEGAAAVKAEVVLKKSPRPPLLERLLQPEMSFQLPLSEMDFPIEGFVRSRYESVMLRRWAYQNIHAQVQGSDLVFDWKIAK